MRWLVTIAILYSITCALAWNPLLQWDVLRFSASSIADWFPSWGTPLDKFWDEAQKYGPKAGDVVLTKVTHLVSGTTAGARDFKHAMDQLVHQAREIRQETMAYLELHEIGSESFFEALASELGIVYKQLEKEVTDPLPRGLSARAEHRKKLAEHVLERIRPVYIKALSKAVPEEKVEAQFDALAPKLIQVVIITGKICDDHPVVLTSMLFAASMLLLPEIQILRPIMSLFGFGPLGPIKGSTAAWVQSRFWGAAVARGSWFAILQKAGMTVVGSWFQRIAASAALASVLGLVVTKSCF